MLGVAPESGLGPRVLKLQGLFYPLSACIMSGPQNLRGHSSSFVWFPVSVAAAPQVPGLCIVLWEGKPTMGLLRDSLLGLSFLSPWSYGRNREICSLKGTFQGNSSKSLPSDSGPLETPPCARMTSPVRSQPLLSSQSPPWLGPPRDLLVSLSDPSHRLPGPVALWARAKPSGK